MFQFVPRKVAQKLPKAQRDHTVPSFSSAPPPVHSATTHDHEEKDVVPSSSSKGKGRATDASLRDEELAAMLWLAVSDHSLWSNVDLRRMVATTEDGWIPLSYILHNSSYFVPLRSNVSADNALIRAIRSHGQDLLEARMLVTSPTRSAWYGKDKATEEDEGGYEVRRRDWNDALTRVRNSTRAEWETRTVYMENIPIQHRSVPGIYHFANSLLSGPGPTTRIQGVSLPPHHLDRPGDVPKCKGFAVVTFSNVEDATRLVAEWPWLPRRTSGSTEHAHEAAKFGFRTLSKARWDGLKEEYLAYRQRLFDSLADASGDFVREDVDKPETNGDYADDTEDTMGVKAPPTKPWLDPSALFPPGCLVFVRNVHPETNKTTLKTLFTSHAFGGSTASLPAALDYVDYNKGMASCHLRLSNAESAQILVSAFSSRPLTQCQGLDNAGSPASDAPPSSKPISAELVDGEREVLYWNKVPEKVRREAVRKAIEQLSAEGGHEPHECAALQDGQDVEGQAAKRPRKRRRKA